VDNTTKTDMGFVFDFSFPNEGVEMSVIFYPATDGDEPSFEIDLCYYNDSLEDLTKAEIDTLLSTNGIGDIIFTASKMIFEMKNSEPIPEVTEEDRWAELDAIQPI